MTDRPDLPAYINCTYTDHVGERSLHPSEFRNNGRWCKACAAIHSRKAYQRNKTQQLAGHKRLERKHECVCPKCGKKHNLKLYWTGTTTPRKFCRSCKQLTETSETEDFPVLWG